MENTELPEKFGDNALPPENIDLKSRIQQMREFDIAHALSKKRKFGEGSAEEVFEIAHRPDEYYIEKIKKQSAEK